MRSILDKVQIAVAVEYLGKMLDRHNQGASENDIRSAFRDFLIRTAIAKDESEIVTETRPAKDSRKKVDLYIRNTYVEFKKSIIKTNAIAQEYIDQLDNYILENAAAGNGIQNGILTDGKNFLMRSVGDHLRALYPEAHSVFGEAKQGHRLYEYLYSIIETEAVDISPSDENLTKYFGNDSAVFKTATALLSAAHGANRDDPTVEVKRKLWKDLLQVALGDEKANDLTASDWLFVRHTYLTCLIALIVQNNFNIDVEHHSRNDPTGLLNGELLAQNSGLKGIIESDLFTWPLEVGQTEYLRTIARQVVRFAWDRTEGELTSTLYQNTVTEEEREQLGEYYTPRWLAQAMTEELIEDPINTRVLDPACGSGTFIASAVAHLIANTQELSAQERLALVQKNVAGIDLHPVAVQLAKATWVMSCQPVIMAARRSGSAGQEIVAPIHLGDSLQLRYDSSRLTGHGVIELRTGETLSSPTGSHADEIVFQIPIKLAKDVDRFDNVMVSLARAIERDGNTDTILDQFGITEDFGRTSLQQTIASMRALHAAGRNHVWAYYLRNMTRPAVISEQKVDAIIGNPPWLTYNQSAGIIREELKNLSRELYQIWAGGRFATHQDVASLFFCRVLELYLKEGGRIGMVMPHSALRSGQHHKWRSGYYSAKVRSSSGNAKRAMSVDFSLKHPWDLSRLRPNDFFPITSCVVFGSFNGGWGDWKRHQRVARALSPGKVEVWRGEVGEPSIGRELSELIGDDGSFRSPYATVSSQGPTISDRRLFFVKTAPNDTAFALPNTQRTFAATSSMDEKSYSVTELRGVVVDDYNIFDIYLGESLAPYLTLNPKKAVLPTSRETLTISLDHSNCLTNQKTGSVKHECELDLDSLNDRMRARWTVMERLWDENKKPTDRKTLFRRLNYNGSLTSQLATLRAGLTRRPRLAYTTSGRPTAALIADRKAILDTTLYQVICASKAEAYYLLAIINSIALEDAVEPFRPTGRFGKTGARHLHKHLWKLPIPRYNPSDRKHTKLSRLGRTAAKSARDYVGDTEGQSYRTIRGQLRHKWQAKSRVCSAIEVAVSELLNGDNS